MSPVHFLAVLFLVLVHGLQSARGFDKTAIGIIVKPGEEIELEAIKRSFWLKERVLDIRPPASVELFSEIVEDGNSVELDRAMCRLLNNGIQALIATTTPLSYRVLLPYSNDYNLPFVSPGFPEINPQSVANHGISVEPSTTRPLLDLIRYYGWKDIVYIYDSDDGPERLQQIFLLGYRILKTRLIGIMRIQQAGQANAYLKKLDFAKKHRSFHVILDMKPELAKTIVVNHVNDVHVANSNFHFLITKLVLEEFWNQNATEMGSVNVTGFLLRLSDNPAAKHFQAFLQQSVKDFAPAGSELPITAFYSYDAALALSDAVDEFHKSFYSRSSGASGSGRQRENATRSCLFTRTLSSGLEISKNLKEMDISSGITGRLRFGFTGTRKNYGMDVVETHQTGHRVIAHWTDTRGLEISSAPASPSPSASARTDNRKKLKITSVLHTPYLMMNTASSNGTDLKGNDRYIGFLKDLIELLDREMDFDYEINPEKNGRYGKFDEATGQWVGMIGEVIRGEADMAMADLMISPSRHGVVDFTEPYEMVTLSLMMKNPTSVAFSSPYFIFSSFAGNVWICILAAAIVVAFVLYVIGRFTGSPDNIESASGLWGKKFTPVNSVWFTSGSMLLQSTGVYPRSVSSRILSAAWWCFTLIMLALFIANITCQLHVDRLDTEQNPQLAKLKTLSLESIVAETVLRGWPVIGVIRGGTTENFVRVSNLSTYKGFSQFLDSHPEAMVSNSEEGIRRVRQSNGDFGVLMESSRNQYVSNHEPCDTIMIHDSTTYAGYGIAVPLGSPLRYDLNRALRTIRERGELGHLHRKWWIDGSQCLEKDFLKKAKESSLGLRSMSGIFYVILICLALTAVVTVGQYFWRVHKKEERRQKVSFEDMTLDQSDLPSPHPELLSDAPLEEDSGIIDGWAERRLIPTSFGERSSS